MKPHGNALDNPNLHHLYEVFKKPTVALTNTVFLTTQLEAMGFPKEPENKPTR